MSWVPQAVLTGLIAGLTTYFVARQVTKNAVNDVKEQVFGFLESVEGVKTLGAIGQVVGAGFSQSLRGLMRGSKGGKIDVPFIGKVDRGLLEVVLGLPQVQKAIGKNLPMTSGGGEEESILKKAMGIGET